MLAKPEGWSVVLVGFWNRMIFTPEWVTQKLTSTKEVGIELPLGTPGLPPRLVFEGVNIRIEPRRLVIGTDAASGDRLAIMERVAVTALAQLPHTPVSGVGVNFQFLESSPNGTLLKVFDGPDIGELSAQGFELKSTQVKRELQRDSVTTNVTLSLTKERSVLVDFNFHRDGDQETATEFLAGKTSSYQSIALDVLDKTYGLSS